MARPMMWTPTLAFSSSTTALLALTSPPSWPWGSLHALRAMTQSWSCIPPSPSGLSSLWFGPAA